MITKRRQWMAALALSAAAALAGCASQVEGSGSFAAGTVNSPTDQQPTDQQPTGDLPTGDLPTGGLPTGGLPTVLPTGLPTGGLPTTVPTQPSDTGGQPTTQPPTGQPTTQSSGGSITPNDPNDTAPGQKICDAVSKDQLQKIFGEPATATKTNDSACEFKSAKHDAIIGVFKDYGDGMFTVTGQKTQDETQADSGKDLTIAGHPACLTAGKNLVVSRTSSPDTGGIVKAYGIFDATDNQIATDLLTLIVPHFVM